MVTVCQGDGQSPWFTHWSHAQTHTHTHSSSRGSNICSEVENLLLAAATSASPPFKTFLAWARRAHWGTYEFCHPSHSWQTPAATGRPRSDRARRLKKEACAVYPRAVRPRSSSSPAGSLSLLQDARSTRRWTFWGNECSRWIFSGVCTQ